MLLIILGSFIILIGVHINESEEDNNSNEKSTITIESSATKETFENNPEIKIIEKEKSVGEQVEKIQEQDDTSTAVAIARNIESYSTNLWYLSCVIYHEGRGLSDEAQIAIASVVLNRVNSDNFPNNIFEVIVQHGQYSFVNDEIIYGSPDERARKNAKYVIDFGSQIPTNVVYQSMGIQGSGIWKIIDGEYFCYE